MNVELAAPVQRPEIDPPLPQAAPSPAQMRRELEPLAEYHARLWDQLIETAIAQEAPEDFRQDLVQVGAANRHFLQHVRELPDQEAGQPPRPLADIRHSLRDFLSAPVMCANLWTRKARELLLDKFLPELLALQAMAEKLFSLVRRVRDTGKVDVHPHAPRTESPTGRLLVVDDNPVHCAMLGRVLREFGHEVHEAGDGDAALEQLGRDKFDLVLLDFQLPGQEGDDVLRRLQADTRWRHIPVLMLSGLDDPGTVVTCIEMGARDFLPKSCDPRLLWARINACLREKRWHDREMGHLRQIEAARRRHRQLLLEILPSEIVHVLYRDKKVDPRRYESVGVLFLDIVGFTPYCSRLGNDPERIVRALEQLVQTFEEIAAKHEVQKIKTIGDAIMAAANLLRPVENPVLSLVHCGREMIEAVRTMGNGWRVRVGINIGPVVAGVLGRHQHLYDLWGDTVNTAARMESHGVPDLITLSPDAWQQVDAYCHGTFDRVEVKGKGWMDVVRTDGVVQEQT